MPPPVLPSAGTALPARSPVRLQSAVFGLVILTGLAVPVSAQRNITEQIRQQQREQLDDPSFRELIPLIPERRVRRDERVPIFYPPNPPALDRPIAHLVPPPGRLAAPAELSQFVNESFYPALGTRLHTNTLYPSMRKDLEVYRTSKIVLQNEIRTLADRHRDSEPAVRRQALEDLAKTQTPKIVELEKLAEDLRRDMITTNFSWSALREWHLVDSEKRGFSPSEIAMVMRGYAFYHRALSTSQRRLLREIVLELQSAVEAEGAPPKINTAAPIFFSPEPARITLPNDLPPALATKVAAYQTKKSQLKKELYDRVHAYDGAAFGLFRASLKSLAEKQADGFATLESLAEEIRRGLADLPKEEKPEEFSPLPPILAYRVSNVMRDRALAQRDATVRADAILARRYDNDVRIRGAYRFDDNGMRVIVLPARAPDAPPPPGEAEILAKVHAELTAVADAYGRRLAELVNEQDAIRDEGAALLKDPKKERVDHALIVASRLAIRQENEDAYRDYRIAVLEPGLSPEQRRLLFDRAIEKLDLPLPRGEVQVSKRSNRW
jgi:hypothetical protein